MKEPKNPPIRQVHLLGGLRAYDVPRQGVEVGQDRIQYFKFDNVPYHHLYSVLEKMNLTPIGVNYIESREQREGTHPTNFEMIGPKGSTAMRSMQEWNNIAFAQRKKNDFKVVSVASRIATYLKLLSRRLFQVSEAYYNMSREPRIEAMNGISIIDNGFNNLWSWELQTTIHGFLADAATLRDILAEAVWKLIMENHDDTVLTMGRLMKEAKNEKGLFIKAFIELGKDGNWLKDLTEIRNETTHVVPVNDFHETFSCYIREVRHNDKPLALIMHCPLTTDTWGLRKDAIRDANFSDETQAKDALRHHKEYVKNSGDALEYCWRTLQRFAEWSEKIRVEAKLKANIPVIDMSAFPEASVKLNP